VGFSIFLPTHRLFSTAWRMYSVVHSVVRLFFRRRLLGGRYRALLQVLLC